MSLIEERLHEALSQGTSSFDESPDLFARVRLSIEDDRRIRRQHRRLLCLLACILGAVAALTLLGQDARAAADTETAATERRRTSGLAR